MNYPWPAPIVAAFARAIEIDGHKNEAAVIEMLERALGSAIYDEIGQTRIGGLLKAYETSYTPLGEASVYIMQKYQHTVIRGDDWNKAVNTLYAYVAGNEDKIIHFFETGKMPE